MSIKQLKNYVRDCVSNYAKFDGEQYSLSLSDIPDFVQHEFAAHIMGEDEAYASEATSPDNKLWDSKMFPALQSYLKNSTDKDEAFEFNRIWRDCVTSYCHSRMEELIEDALQDYNQDEGYTVKDWNNYYGVSHLFGARP